MVIRAKAGNGTIHIPTKKKANADAKKGQSSSGKKSVSHQNPASNSKKKNTVSKSSTNTEKRSVNVTEDDKTPEILRGAPALSVSHTYDRPSSYVKNIPNSESSKVRQSKIDTPQDSVSELSIGSNAVTAKATHLSSGSLALLQPAGPVADRIEDLLDHGGGIFGFTQWVTTGEVEEVVNEFAQLDAEDANAVFDELETRGLVDDLVKEIYDSSHFNNGGLPDDVRKGFYDDLGRKLNAENSIGMIEALKAGPSVRLADERVEAIEEFAHSIVEQSNDSEKVLSIIEKTADQTTEGPFHDQLTMVSENWPRDPDALVTARLIAGLEGDPAATSKALSLLKDEELDAVIRASLAKAGGVNALPIEIRSIQQYIDMAKAVNEIDNTDAVGIEQISRFVDISSNYLRDHKVIQTHPEAKDALTEIFLTHFDEMIGHSLAQNSAITSDFQDDLVTFSHYVLFSDAPSDLQSDAVDLFSSKIDDWLEIAEGGDIDDQISIGNEKRDRETFANLAGQLLAATLNGLQFSMQDRSADAAGKELIATFLINLAVDVIPIADKAEKIVNSVFGAIKTTGKAEILSEIKHEDYTIDISDFTEFYTAIRDTIGSKQDIDTAEDLRRAFEDGFTSIRPPNVERPTS